MASHGGAVKYGSAEAPFSHMRGNEFFLKGQRRRLNIIAVLVSLFLPWLLFCFMTAILTFSIHYRQPFVVYILIWLTFLIGVCLPAALASNALRRKQADPAYQPSWYIFLFATCTLAFLVGAIVGNSTYTNYMWKYYNLKNLAAYDNIDTNAAVGQLYMDAGRIEFKKGTELDLGRSMGFKSHDIYCVSPIVTKSSVNATAETSVDFWAVGKNCCSGVSADFHCDGFADPNAIGALRLVHDEDRPFYRLAVQQAEATYKMTSTHPLFFEWVRSPEDSMNAFANQGCTNYFISICSYFFLQLFFVVVATLLFAKMGRL
jgi:hypothetical protein